MDTSYKDPELKGLYVKRCKCGLRPYYDRIDPLIPHYGCWIQCVCGRIGMSGSSKKEAISNWNNNNLYFNQFLKK